MAGPALPGSFKTTFARFLQSNNNSVYFHHTGMISCPVKSDAATFVYISTGCQARNLDVMISSYYLWRLHLMIRLLAIDLDGTLFNSQQQVSPVNRRAIQLACQAGIAPIIATGRGQQGVEFSLDRLGLELPHICSAGALIRESRDGPPIMEKTFQAMNEFKHVINFVRCHDLALIADLPGGGLWFGPDVLVEQLDPLTAASTLDTRTFSPEDDFDQPLLKTTVVVPPDLLERAITLVEQNCPSLQHTLASERYLDITAREVNKGSALAFYAARKGFNCEEIAAIGDQLIDISMLEVAGLSAAVDNAHPAVKACSDLVVPSNDNDGVARFIEKLLPG
jgi:Cof subfamily protein (haloacid dehalogenase superfamily)